jgi:RHS repeat-associated protein
LTGITVKNDLGEIIRTAEYTYDVYNQRIAKTVDTDGDGSLAAVTERFVYGRDQNIALVLDENGNVNHRYLFGNGVDQIEADESNGNVLWALTDHLGSVRDIVDDSGTVLNHVVYDAFGGVTSQTNSSVVFRYGYTAREFDAESGLQYNRARYLDSFTGKFISEDPISFEGGDFNLYRYVFNSPLNGTDPSGEVTVYDALNAADQFFGSFSRVTTFGATDYVREKIYGNDVNKNQTGTFANLGTGAGVVTSFLLGGAAPNALVRVTNLQRLAQAYTVIGTGIGAYKSTRNILDGCATPLDALSFAPLAGFGAKNIFKTLDGIRSRTIFRAVSDEELKDIANFGFRPNPNQRGYQDVKLFAPTIKEAAQFGKNNYRYDKIPNTIVEVKVPNRIMKESLKFPADRMNAISIDSDKLHLLKVKPLNYSPYLK